MLAVACPGQCLRLEKIHACCPVVYYLHNTCPTKIAKQIAALALMQQECALTFSASLAEAFLDHGPDIPVALRAFWQLFTHQAE